MRVVPIHLEPGSDLRVSLEQLAADQGAAGFVLGVVGNLSRAAFQCPGRPGPSVLEGDLEIITLQGTLAPHGVHLHLSLSDGDCQVWGGHLEPGTLIRSGADLLVGLLQGDLTADGPSEPPTTSHSAPPSPAHRGQAIPFPRTEPGPPRLEIAVLEGCPYSARALRMLRTLGVPHQLEVVTSPEQRQALAERSGQPSLPQIFMDGLPIGGYDALADLHQSGVLERLRHPE
jgi:predicted DNA-binding protein with PD1-like motif/glutaredoxin